MDKPIGIARMLEKQRLAPRKSKADGCLLFKLTMELKGLVSTYQFY